MDVSIHASTKDATTDDGDYYNGFACFNPRIHEGCDTDNVGNVLDVVLFQSTHPRRMRQSPISVSHCFKLFQSTHPRRMRLAAAVQSANSRLFQSTHPRRMRRGIRLSVCRLGGVSIHASTKDATILLHGCQSY